MVTACRTPIRVISALRESAAHKYNMTLNRTTLELDTLATIAEIDPDARTYFHVTSGKKSLTVVPSKKFRACDIYALKGIMTTFQTAANS
jgi:hypothetical protein